MEDEDKAREREARRAARSADEGLQEMAPVDEADAPEFVPVRPQETEFENKMLAPLEADILSFLLRFGDRLMKFETDSEYYTEEVSNVTDFIRGAIEEEGLQNSVYSKTYDAFVDAYCEGLDQAAIVRRLLGSQDPDIVKVASELSFEKYQITVQNFNDSMMNVESWLVNYVPKTILMYAERRVQLKIDFLKDSLAKSTDSDEQLKIMQALVKFQKFQRELKKKIK